MTCWPIDTTGTGLQERALLLLRLRHSYQQGNKKQGTAVPHVR